MKTLNKILALGVLSLVALACAAPVAAAQDNSGLEEYRGFVPDAENNRGEDPRKDGGDSRAPGGGGGGGGLLGGAGPFDRASDSGGAGSPATAPPRNASEARERIEALQGVNPVAVQERRREEDQARAAADRRGSAGGSGSGGLWLLLLSVSLATIAAAGGGLAMRNRRQQPLTES